MAELLQFDKTDEWYIAQSATWSKRGDSYRSLLYARRAAEKSRKGEMRLATALYESGNFHLAAEKFVELYLAGEQTTELYVGLIKSLSGMFRHRAALFFLEEGQRKGLLPAWGGNLSDEREYVQAMEELRREYPDEVADKEFSQILFLYYSGYMIGNDNLLREVGAMSDVVSPDLFFSAAAVSTLQGLNNEFATKMLQACERSIEESPFPRADLLAIKIICLVKLGRTEEADLAADDLVALDLPEDDVTVLKCAQAMAALGDYESALDYIEELLNVTYNENLVLLASMTSLNINNNKLAKELFSDVLLINPRNVVADYWCKRLVYDGKYTANEEHQLPWSEQQAITKRIETILAEARLHPGDIEETEQGRNELLYVLLGEDTDFAIYVGCTLVQTGVYTDVVRSILTRPNARILLCRDILTEMICRDARMEEWLFIYGLRRVRVGIDLDAKNISAELRRAYAGALATVWVFSPENVGDLDEMFEAVLPTVSEISLRTEREINSMAAAFLLLSRVDDIRTPKDAVDWFIGADTRLANNYCASVEQKHPAYHAPDSPKKRKRR